MATSWHHATGSWPGEDSNANGIEITRLISLVGAGQTDRGRMWCDAELIFFSLSLSLSFSLSILLQECHVVQHPSTFTFDYMALGWKSEAAEGVTEEGFNVRCADVAETCKISSVNGVQGKG